MDYAAGFLEILGVVMIGNLRRHGFLVCLGCNALWIAVAIHTGVNGLIPVSVVMAGVNVRNYLRWTRQGVS